MDRNHICTFGRRNYGEYSCGIIFYLDRVVQEMSLNENVYGRTKTNHYSSHARIQEFLSVGGEGGSRSI